MAFPLVPTLIGVFVAIIVLAIISVKIYLKLTAGWAKLYTCLIGKTVIITGANTGIGYEVALDMAGRGAKVILACRNETKAKEARDKIVEVTSNENVTYRYLDMASFESVRKFAREINETEERLDILVNNAGIIAVGNVKSKDGYDLVMQVNHYSGFLLTNLLLDLLKRSKPSRVITHSSNAAQFNYHFDLDKINTYSSDPMMYSNSKVCNILFTIELAKRLKGTGVTAYSLHPGVVRSEIFRYTKGLYKLILCYLGYFFFKTPEEGKQTTLYCCLEPGLEKYSGEHFVDCKRVRPYGSVSDPLLPDKLWELSEKVVKLRLEQLDL